MNTEVPSIPAVAEITIEPNLIDQTIDGFGVSGAWWAQEVGGWQADNRNRIIELLFNPTTGIGLSIYRYNIGAGGGAEIADPWRRTNSLETAQRVYDWHRDENAIRILQSAFNAGANQIVAFANSPPPRLTRSGMVSGGFDGSSNLGLNQEEAYAQYLVDIVRYLQDQLRIPINWISPVNEPQWSWSINNQQEGCHYTPGEVAALTDALAKKIQDTSLTVGILIPESGNWSDGKTYLQALAQYPGALQRLKIFAVHSYASTAKDKSDLSGYIQAVYPNLKIWMSEWVEMKPGRDYGMDSAITLASTIHDDLTLGKASSWQYWIAVSKYDYHDGLIYITPGTQNIQTTKRLWAFGNYSRFVRPGYQLISSKAESSPLLVTAFQSEDRGSIVAVVINPSQENLAARLNLSDRNWLKMTAYETSSQSDLIEIYDGSFPSFYVFPRYSITTLIIKP